MWSAISRSFLPGGICMTRILRTCLPDKICKTWGSCATHIICRYNRSKVRYFVYHFPNRNWPYDSIKHVFMVIFCVDGIYQGCSRLTRPADRVRRCSEYHRSGQEIFKLIWRVVSVRVKSFPNLTGRVESGQGFFQTSRVGSGQVKKG